MDNADTALDLARLTAQARAHYNAARWDEALAAIAQIEAHGGRSPELDELAADIRLKQRIEAVQVPTKAPPRRPRGLALPLLGAGGALALLAAAALALAPLLRGGPARPQPADLSRNLAAALPTAAPTAAPAPAEPGSGVLTVGGLAGDSAVGVRNVYLILDASGSMLARVGERRKIAVAQEALVGLVGALPADATVALRTYGHRRADDCGDVQLLAQPGPLYREGLIAQIQAITPVNLSRTPIAAALQATALDLAAMPGETLVVLVSDGEESCGGDPAAAAAAIRAARPDVRVSVVGFDIAPELRERLAGIALAGGGLYVDAADVGQLKAALRQVTAPSFRVLDPAGAEVGRGLLGEGIELPRGRYTLLVGGDPVLLQEQVEVREGQATSVTIADAGGSLTAEIRRDWRP
jgi:hypothetical protein